MSMVLVLMAVVAAGCGGTESGPEPGEGRRVEPGIEDPATRDPAPDQGLDGADTDEGAGNDEPVDGEPEVAEGPRLDPTELRTRWNALAGTNDEGGGGLGAELLAMGELHPVEADTMVAPLGNGEVATVSAALGTHGTLRTITITYDDPNATPLSSALTQAALSRLLLASTLPSRPALPDPAVRGPAEALALHGSRDEPEATATVVVEGITYATHRSDDRWTITAQTGP